MWALSAVPYYDYSALTISANITKLQTCIKRVLDKPGNKYAGDYVVLILIWETLREYKMWYMYGMIGWWDEIDYIIILSMSNSWELLHIICVSWVC